MNCSTSGDKNTGENPQFVSRNLDSIAKIDSMRWYYYVMNCYGEALFYDSSSQKQVKIAPAECDAILDQISKVNKDSSTYYFSFFKPGMYFKYVDKIVYCSGIKDFNHNISPSFHLVKMDIESNTDSMKIYLRGSDSSFRAYLKGYKGHISDWLKQEAIKRKVL